MPGLEGEGRAVWSREFGGANDKGPGTDSGDGQATSGMSLVPLTGTYQWLIG